MVINNQTTIENNDTRIKQQSLGFMAFLATDGGRKCLQCGRYAQPKEIGNLSKWFYNEIGEKVAHISQYGHLPGYGCNVKRIP